MSTYDCIYMYTNNGVIFENDIILKNSKLNYRGII